MTATNPLATAAYVTSLAADAEAAAAKAVAGASSAAFAAGEITRLQKLVDHAVRAGGIGALAAASRVHAAWLSIEPLVARESAASRLGI